MPDCLPNFEADAMHRLYSMWSHAYLQAVTRLGIGQAFYFRSCYSYLYVIVAHILVAAMVHIALADFSHVPIFPPPPSVTTRRRTCFKSKIDDVLPRLQTRVCEDRCQISTTRNDFEDEQPPQSTTWSFQICLLGLFAEDLHRPTEKRTH